MQTFVNNNNINQTMSKYSVNTNLIDEFAALVNQLFVYSNDYSDSTSQYCWSVLATLWTIVYQPKTNKYILKKVLL